MGLAMGIALQPRITKGVTETVVTPMILREF
jgi:hypothetical protein